MMMSKNAPATSRPPATTFRLTDDDRRLLSALSEQLGLSQVGTLRLALRDLARRQLGAPAPAKRAKKKAGSR